MVVTDSNRAFSGIRVSPSAPPAWKEIIEPVRPFLDKVGQRLADQVESFDSEIVPYAQYALSNQGKQLRPVLVGLSAGCAGKINEAAINVAVIIEMVHLATLVHDDVMDAAQMRRCRPTVAASWGNEISVLLGDCLFAHALRLAASFPTPEVCRAVAAATKTVCSGEILQTHKRRTFELNRAEYFKVVGMKTAELFALSCDLGAATGGALPAQRASLRQYGCDLGTAYQVYDDCVDLFEREDRAGKSLGTDLASGKLTLPILVLAEKVEAADRAFLRDLIRRWDALKLPQVLELLEKYDALGECREIVGQYLARAREGIASLPETQCAQGLIGLTEFLSQQTDGLGVT